MTVRRVLLCVAAVALIVTVAPAAMWGQTRPNPAAPGGAYQPPPPPMAQPQPPPPQMPPSEFQPSGYPESYGNGNDYPRQEVNAVPPAYVRLVIARAQLRRAESALNRAVGDIRRAFDRSRDWIAALNDEREAWDAYQAARNKSLQGLRSDPSYLASVNLKQSIASQIEDLRRDSRQVTEDLLAMATVKMGYASTASAMEAAAVAADPDVQSARQRLRSASAKLSELRARFDNEVRTSQTVLDARRNLDDLRIAHLAIDANFWATLDARNIALDYAIFLHRYDLYQYLNYGYYSGYYGYGTPYYRIGYPAGYPYSGMRY